MDNEQRNHIFKKIKKKKLEHNLGIKEAKQRNII